MKYLVSAITIAITLFAILFLIFNEKVFVFHPKGQIAKSELTLILTNIFLMLAIIIPTTIALLTVAWKYRAENKKTTYRPQNTGKPILDLLLWIIPCFIVIPMALITWKATHKLNPYLPLEHENKTLKIQVVALRWKWLFLYPEQGIASLNFVQFPEKTPIHFELCADEAPMNSFWIPQLSGQIYAMTGMVTPLHLIADHPGEFPGKAAEINGDGYARMTFLAKATSQKKFETWVEDVKKSPQHLSLEQYNALVKPSIDPVILYSNVEKELFNTIVMKYMVPAT